MDNDNLFKNDNMIIIFVIFQCIFELFTILASHGVG
jgi:hypothetical protein